jgi:hypothetical protein
VCGRSEARVRAQGTARHARGLCAGATRTTWEARVQAYQGAAEHASPRTNAVVVWLKACTCGPACLARVRAGRGGWVTSRSWPVDRCACKLEEEEGCWLGVLALE